MYNILFQAHSGLRFLVFIAIVIAILSAFSGWFGNKPFTKGNRVLNLLTMIFTHLQALLGIFLYFVSPYVQFGNMGATMKDSTFRYWTVEHIVMMLIAVVLITIGNTKSKKGKTAIAQHKPVAIYFTLGLLVVLVAIFMSGRALFVITH